MRVTEPVGTDGVGRARSAPLPPLPPIRPEALAGRGGPLRDRTGQIVAGRWLVLREAGRTENRGRRGRRVLWLTHDLDTGAERARTTQWITKRDKEYRAVRAAV